MDRKGFDYICTGTYGRRRDGSIWIDVRTKARDHGCEPSPAFARALIKELRGHGVASLIVAKVSGWDTLPLGARQ